MSGNTVDRDADASVQLARPLRILWLIKGLGPGGAERLLVSVAETMRSPNLVIEAAYLVPWKSHLVEELERVGVRTRCLDARSVHDLRWAVRLRHLLLEERPDIVHVHSPAVAGIARLVVRSLPLRVRPRLVATEHNVWRSYGLPTRAINAATYAFDAHHLAVSSEVAESVPWPWNGSIEVLVHGVPIARLHRERRAADDARSRLALPEGHLLAVTVANYRADKAYPDLFHAARRVIDAGVPVTFVAIGQGALQVEIEALHAQLQLGNRVRLLGYVPNPLPIVAAADLFVLASHHEGLPVAVMEALALGVPVVATRVGGIPEAVRDGVDGVLVPPGDPTLLAAAIARVATDNVARRAMAGAAAERGRDFDIARAAERIAEIYRDLAARN